MRITPTGAVSIIVRPPCSDGWSWCDDDCVQFAGREAERQLAGREAEHAHRTYLASSHPVNDQLRTSVVLSYPQC